MFNFYENPLNPSNPCHPCAELTEFFMRLLWSAGMFLLYLLCIYTFKQFLSFYEELYADAHDESPVML